MNQELGPLQRVVEFLYSIGLPPLRIFRGLVTILVIGVVIGGIYFFAFKDESESARRDDSQDSTTTETDKSNGLAGTEFTTTSDTSDRTSYEFELSLDQEVEEMFYFNSNDFGYVIIAGEFDKQKELIRKLRQRQDLTEKHKSKLAQIELRNSRVLVERQMLAGIDSSESLKSFEDLAQSLANGPNEELKDLANYSLAKISATNLIHFTTEQNAKNVIDTFQNTKPAFQNNRSRIDALLAQLLATRNKNQDKPFVGECVQSLGKILLSSKESEIVKLGEQIGEFTLFANYGMATLENRIRYQASDALPDFDNALRVLEANPDVEISVWKMLIRCSEASLSTGRTRDFETARNIISDLVNKLPDSDPKKSELAGFLERQLKRSTQIGTKFEFGGSTLRGREIATSSSQFSLLVFVSRNQPSIKVMADLMKTGSESIGTFRSIVVFKDPFTEDDNKRVDMIPTWVTVASDKTSEQYANKFSVDSFPYLFLIDKQGIVVAGNLTMVQAKNRIATIEKKEREQRNGSPESTSESSSE